MTTPERNPQAYLWHFETFLENAPRVGALQLALYDGEPDKARLRRFFLNGNLSFELMTQFKSWLNDHERQ